MNDLLYLSVSEKSNQIISLTLVVRDRRDFRKILPFLLKSRFLLLSLHLYTKWICGFDSPLNFEETGAKKVP